MYHIPMKNFKNRMYTPHLHMSRLHVHSYHHPLGRMQHLIRDRDFWAILAVTIFLVLLVSLAFWSAKSSASMQSLNLNIPSDLLGLF